MHNANVYIFPDRPLGQIGNRLWGQFIELTGRCINDGLYEPGSPLSRKDGIRQDVLEALRELKPTHIRYPGGCAAAYFDWQELVGPTSQRPRAKLFRSTGQVQSTGFGIPEAYALCLELGAELYLTINAHTQSPEDAANLVEYLNGTKHTKYADLRRSHGREEPYNVKLFGLGNEIYGDWQPGVKTAAEYVSWCSKAISEMKAVDPAIDIVCVGCGRYNREWDRQILKGLIDKIDMISVHNYFGRPIFADCMAASRVCEEMFASMNLAIDEAMDSCLTRKKRPTIAFDEWNIWYRTRHGLEADLEEVFDYTDALTIASLMHVMLRNSGAIAVSNISLLANTLGLVFTDPERMARQTIFYPHMLLRNSHGGTVVQTVNDGPTFKAKHERYFCGIVDVEKANDDSVPTLLHYDNVEALDVVTTIDREHRKMVVSIVQKLEKDSIKATLHFSGLKPMGATMTVNSLKGSSLSAKNTLDNPNNVGIETRKVPASDTLELPPASLTVVEYGI